MGDEIVQEIESKMEELVELQARNTELGMIGSPDDDELAQLNECRENVKECKEQLAEYIEQMEGCELSESGVEAMENLLINCCTHGDDDINVVNAILTYWSHDCADILNNEGLLSLACADGNEEVVERLLKYPGIAVDEEEVVPLACYNATRRVPLLKILLNAENVDFSKEDIQDTVQPAIQEMFVDVCQKCNDKEDQNDRVEVLTALLKHPHLKIDLDERDVNDSTIFMRAVMAGDVEVMVMSHEHLPTPLNQVFADGSTYLIRAVFMAQPASVQWLLDQPEVDPNLETPNGRAIDVAKMKGNQEILDMLKAKDGAAGPQAPRAPSPKVLPPPRSTASPGADAAAPEAPPAGAAAPAASPPGGGPAEPQPGPARPKKADALAARGTQAASAAPACLEEEDDEDDEVEVAGPSPSPPPAPSPEGEGKGPEGLTLEDVKNLALKAPPTAPDTTPLRDVFQALAPDAAESCSDDVDCCLVTGPTRGLRGFVGQLDVVDLVGEALAGNAGRLEHVHRALAAALARPVRHLLHCRVGHGVFTDGEAWPPGAKPAHFIRRSFLQPPGLVYGVAFCRAEATAKRRPRLALECLVTPLTLLHYFNIHGAAIPPHIAGQTLREAGLCRAPRHTMPLDAPAHECVALMYAHRLVELPLTDPGGRVCAVLEARHLYQAVARAEWLAQPISGCLDRPPQAVPQCSADITVLDCVRYMSQCTSEFLRLEEDGAWVTLLELLKRIVVEPA